MDLQLQAQEILKDNWRDGFSIPTAKLYPFQWLWDSGFVAMGSGYFDLDKSIQEIKKMFSGQWGNGLLPHILFHSETEKSYFPNFDFWNSNINKGAPHFPKSSGITQPPVFGFIIHQLLKGNPKNEKLKSFITAIFPKVVNAHRFLYNYRDHKKEGLFYIYHPWESGRDNSPIWDDALNRIEITPGSIPSYQRRDTQIMDASERPTSDKYDRYVYLLELGKKYKYDGKEIAESSPFLIQDCMMNSILIKSNDSLIQIGKEFDLDTSEIEEWQSLSTANFHNKFWNDDINYFVSYDCRSNEQILHKEIGGLVPVFANLANKSQVEKMASYLTNIHERGYYLCPSFDIDSPLFDSKRYWRGPVWPQMNWMISEGFKNYGYTDLSNIIKDDFIELVTKLGFYEYFESEKDKVKTLTKGYGGNRFSWTASSIITFLNND